MGYFILQYIQNEGDLLQDLKQLELQRSDVNIVYCYEMYRLSAAILDLEF